MTIWKWVLISCLGGLLLAGSVALADTYTYDAYGRLMGVTFSDGSSVSYQYDPAGNRLVVSQTP
jgi:hypothetical protein